MKKMTLKEAKKLILDYIQKEEDEYNEPNNVFFAGVENGYRLFVVYPFVDSEDLEKCIDGYMLLGYPLLYTEKDGVVVHPPLDDFLRWEEKYITGPNVPLPPPELPFPEE